MPKKSDKEYIRSLPDSTGVEMLRGDIVRATADAIDRWNDFRDCLFRITDFGDNLGQCARLVSYNTGKRYYACNGWVHKDFLCKDVFMSAARRAAKDGK